MSVRSIGALAAQRRSLPAQRSGAAASGPERPAASGLEATVPAEVITLYTAVIAGCESVVGTGSYFPFRVAVYAFGVLATIVTAARGVHAATRDITQTALSAEVQTAVLSFVAWGLVLPGSFLYVCLSKSALSITIVTVTATAGFLLAVFYAPQLRLAATPPSGSGPPLTNDPPVAGGQ